MPKTISEPEKILELRKLLRVSSLSVIPKIPYNAAYRAQISNNVAVDAYVLFARDTLLDKNAYKSFLNTGFVNFRYEDSFKPKIPCCVQGVLLEVSPIFERR